MKHSKNSNLSKPWLKMNQDKKLSASDLTEVGSLPRMNFSISVKNMG